MGDDAGLWVELRVHGVSGTPPESLLAHPDVAQVDGGESSRFFRPVDAAGDQIRGADGQILEAYHWGKYTSGSWQQALWLVLVPFGLINAAQFMLPAAPTRPGLTVRSALHAIAGALLRFLALLLTELLIFAAGLTLIDEIAWRWAPTSSRFASWSPTLVFVVAVAGTALVAVALYALAQGSGKECRGDATGPTGPDKYDANRDVREFGSPLANDEFYAGNPEAPTLRRLHLAAGLLLTAAMARWAADGHAWAHRDGMLLVSLGCLLAVIVAVTLLGDPEGSASAVLTPRMAMMRARWHGLTALGSWVAVALGALIVVLSIFQLRGVGAELRSGPARIEAYDAIALCILFSGFAGLVLLMICCAFLGRVSHDVRPAKDDPAWFFRPYAVGMAPALVACLAVFVGVGLSSSVAMAVSSTLKLSVKAQAFATGQKVRVGVTPMLDRVSYAWGLTFVMVLLGLLVFGFRYWASRKVLAKRSEDMFRAAAPVDPQGYASCWSGRLVFAMWVARLKNHVPGIVWTLVLIGLSLSFAMVVELGLAGADFAAWWTRNMPWFVDKLSEPLTLVPKQHSGRATNLIANLGAWLLLTTGGALVVLARLGLKQESSRRGINVIWDVISFWPHAVHPFVPRPYSQSTVPDLRKRIVQHLETRETSDRTVVVCGHSQGSLISFAAVSLLAEEQKSRTALLTFGSQLRLVFSRAFPAYVNFATIARLHGDLGAAWVNLYRETDPLAGPVLSWSHEGEGPDSTSHHFPEPLAGRRPDSYATPARVRRCGDDWRLLDPAPRIDPGQVGPVNQLSGHGDYWLDPAWRDALNLLHRA